MTILQEKISVIMITLNEAENLPACLESVADIAEEIIIVDSHSHDATVDIAKKFGARVIVNSRWPGFGAQKNLALSYARCPWVLSIDADERLTAELKQEIIEKLQRADNSAYMLPRQSYFLGKPVKHSGWYPDYVLRLFRREQGQFSDSLVHEQVVTKGKVGKLIHPLLHYSYRYKEDVLAKINRYAYAGAKQMHAQHRSSFRGQACLHAIVAWLRTFILKRGILDGVTGWRIAMMNAKTTYIKYRELYKLKNISSSAR